MEGLRPEKVRRLSTRAFSSDSAQAAASLCHWPSEIPSMDVATCSSKNVYNMAFCSSSQLALVYWLCLEQIMSLVTLNAVMLELCWTGHDVCKRQTQQLKMKNVQSVGLQAARVLLGPSPTSTQARCSETDAKEAKHISAGHKTRPMRTSLPQTAKFRHDTVTNGHPRHAV